MKRNQYGINFDLGVPLESEWELSNLYVPVYEQVHSQMIAWIQNADHPIYLGGQIGSGKSTAIRVAWAASKKNPDIEFHFDRDGDNLASGDFWRIILSELIQYALRAAIDLNSLNLPKELADLSKNQWKEFLGILNPTEIDRELFIKRRAVQERMMDPKGYIEKACEEIINLVIANSKQQVCFFASGIDKFEFNSAAFHDLRMPLNLLKKFKTLFEVNAIHLYDPLFAGEKGAQLFIPFLSSEKLIKILQLRMGVYAKASKEYINEASAWSGGNPRQAIRMLMLLRHSKALSKEERILYAIHALYFQDFGYLAKPDVALLTTIKNQESLDPTLLSLPGDKETAGRAVYGNWIFLGDRTKNGRIQAQVNPVVQFSTNLVLRVSDPEIQLLKQYSEEHGMSGTGLEINKDIYDSSDAWRDVLGVEFETPIQLNLTESLDVLRDSLLSKDRSDLIIVAYREKNILTAARAYLFAKANTYEFQSFKHFEIIDEQDFSPVLQLRKILKESFDILSIDFVGNDWKKESLFAIDKMRDNFLGRQMIWWIPELRLSEFLQYWIQLRQLFRVFILE
ncbi:MAG: hypothetical protein KJ736_05250, partial [Candidatus Omnitrophica bacterium]|nr:hypothetical protein [Candidatus Omnitrophota bacterium]